MWHACYLSHSKSLFRQLRRCKLEFFLNFLLLDYCYYIKQFIIWTFMFNLIINNKELSFFTISYVAELILRPNGTSFILQTYYRTRWKWAKILSVLISNSETQLVNFFFFKIKSLDILFVFSWAFNPLCPPQK